MNHPCLKASAQKSMIGQLVDNNAMAGIASKRVETVQSNSNVTIDWALWENAQVNLRCLVKCILRKHGYPPDK